MRRDTRRRPRPRRSDYMVVQLPGQRRTVSYVLLAAAPERYRSCPTHLQPDRPPAPEPSSRPTGRRRRPRRPRRRAAAPRGLLEDEEAPRQQAAATAPAPQTPAPAPGGSPPGALPAPGEQLQRRSRPTGPFAPPGDQRAAAAAYVWDTFARLNAAALPETARGSVPALFKACRKERASSTMPPGPPSATWSFSTTPSTPTATAATTTGTPTSAWVEAVDDATSDVTGPSLGRRPGRPFRHEPRAARRGHPRQPPGQQHPAPRRGGRSPLYPIPLRSALCRLLLPAWPRRPPPHVSGRQWSLEGGVRRRGLRRPEGISPRPAEVVPADLLFVYSGQQGCADVDSSARPRLLDPLPLRRRCAPVAEPRPLAPPASELRCAGPRRLPRRCRRLPGPAATSTP